MHTGIPQITTFDAPLKIQKEQYPREAKETPKHRGPRNLAFYLEKGARVTCEKAPKGLLAPVSELNSWSLTVER
jgi:hypothetical protein